MKEPGWPFGNRPKATLLWEVYKTGRIMSCEMNEHPLATAVAFTSDADERRRDHVRRQSRSADAAIGGMFRRSGGGSMAFSESHGHVGARLRKADAKFVTNLRLNSRPPAFFFLGPKAWA